MTISVWRYSHLALAVSSFLFLILASVTGIVLACEPVLEKARPYRTADFDTITLAEALPALKKEYADIIDITVDNNQFVIVKAIDKNGKSLSVYANPKTGKALGEAGKKNEFFQWVTNLHRSLFLHDVGRFFIGISAFLLLLIAVSGAVLIVQRQRGWKGFFTKIVNEGFYQYYHVVLGRLSLIPIVLIAATGTYLSLEKFNIFSGQKISHHINFATIQTKPERSVADFTFFKNTKLSEVQYIEFPFSADAEDYFTIKLIDSEVIVNQITGDILSEVPYASTTLLTNLSLDIHTGRTSFVWAVILAAGSINILFFVYSGFVMTLQRRQNRYRNKFKPTDAAFVILVGSENGGTFRFAKAFHQQLLKSGQTSFIGELNDFKTFPKAAHLIVFTATYGIGNPPTNADKFIALVKKYPQVQPLYFSVIGFGSHAYPDFCKFAFEASNALAQESWATPLLGIHTVNDKSPDDFGTWVLLWTQKTNIPMAIMPELHQANSLRRKTFAVIEKTETAHEDGAFLIRLRPVGNTKFSSGDLLSIYPANDHRERLYSIGKIGKAIQLSVKLHPGGLGSGLLYHLSPGDTIEGYIVDNAHFHFPRKAKTVVMISNGTGIAPFLGMIDQNSNRISCHLYCGFRSTLSFNLYSDTISQLTDRKCIDKFHLAYSREGKKEYVKDLLLRDADFIANVLNVNGVIMICGSLAMKDDVIALLEEICRIKNGKPLTYYQSHNQLLTDCY